MKQSNLETPSCIPNTSTGLRIWFSLTWALCKETILEKLHFCLCFLCLYIQQQLQDLPVNSPESWFLSWNLNKHFPHSKAEPIPNSKVGLRCRRKTHQPARVVRQDGKMGKGAPNGDSILGLRPPQNLGPLLSARVQLQTIGDWGNLLGPRAGGMAVLKHGSSTYTASVSRWRVLPWDILYK